MADENKTMQPLIGLFGLGDQDMVKIKSLDGKEREVSLKLGAAREVRALLALKGLQDQLGKLNLNPPLRFKGEDTDAYNNRVGMTFLNKLFPMLLAMMDQGLLDASAAILGLTAAEVGEQFSAITLAKLVLSFFARLLGTAMEQLLEAVPQPVAPQQPPSKEVSA